MLKNWKKNREKKDKLRKAEACYWAVSFLIKHEITEYMDLRFTEEKTSLYSVVNIEHKNYGKVLTAQFCTSPGILLFHYGEWVDTLLEYRKVVEEADLKKQREEEIDNFKDLPEG